MPYQIALAGHVLQVVDVLNHLHVAAQVTVVVKAHGELDRGDNAGVGTCPNELSGMRVTSTIKVMPPPGQTNTGAPPLDT